MDHPPKTPDEAIRRRQGARIREFRGIRQLTQQDLAATIGVSKAAVSSWETGVASPRKSHQVAVARTLNTTWSALFGLDAEAAA